jgi:hypothetical protein
MNLFEYKWLRKEAEKNKENLLMSSIGSNAHKYGKSCAEIKEILP